MPRLEISGYKRYWPLKQLTGRNYDGTKRSIEGYRNMVTGDFHAPKEGWNGSPPELPTGEREPVFSNRYKDNYDMIKWN